MADFAYRPPAPMDNERWLSSRSPLYGNAFYSARFETGSTPCLPNSVTYAQGAASTHHLPADLVPGGGVPQLRRTPVEPSFSPIQACNTRVAQGPFTTSPAPGQVPFKSTGSWSWDQQPSYPAHNSQGPYQGRYSPSDSMDELASPSLSDYSLDKTISPPAVPSSKTSSRMGGGGGVTKPRSQRRPSNRDEFDGPHQFLKRPPPEYIAMQERELPQLPTHLLVQEQDSVLNKVNERLSQCAYDFVAKYQFPIPLTQDMRPVERPQDREWTEWVYLLKRLATKRRIPARVLYNGQIKQFVTILENSLEMRHATKHQSRPLKDDRNILQLISAGIQVAKILKDAPAMEYLDKLYVSTERRIQERVAAAAAASNAMRLR
ncbi:hypothetical protein MYCTH_2304958 [Thermothelomyces thermophilus ATCC 42464]|uniref:Uncharacterized protein n=1 Tax=Thermothelomyces thermophilus (strain ATCC 42464 / BCRC 31852 / DSM 1799) TaxID=573729 RepID=G2QBT4_THET4|nr:uncharacterized protein MYCTH_2304958 [Thermothelomyces thermophilus ATCC 42464]AEO58017.1 hypothetical protein MYCTH_2304958 [Thermothelomyces thermophilus ATCC 42464]